MIKPKALVLTGDGINCDAETIWALAQAGFQPQHISTTEILESPGKMLSVQLFVLPGGFSFGDEIASGKVLALKLMQNLKDVLHNYIDKGNLLLGICNGFQVLVQMGLLPDTKVDSPRRVSLCQNTAKKFMNRWVELEVSPTNTSPFFQGLTTIHLPVRHGEGKLTLAHNCNKEDETIVKERAALRYADDINGSFDRIAGLTNKEGNVLGLMPHPEAFVRWSQHPAWTSMKYSHTHHGQDLNPSPILNFSTPHGLAILVNTAKAVK